MICLCGKRLQVGVMYSMFEALLTTRLNTGWVVMKGGIGWDPAAYAKKGGGILGHPGLELSGRGGRKGEGRFLGL